MNIYLVSCMVSIFVLNKITAMANADDFINLLLVGQTNDFPLAEEAKTSKQPEHRFRLWHAAGLVSFL